MVGQCWIPNMGNCPLIYADFVTQMNADKRQKISGSRRYEVSVDQRTIVSILTKDEDVDQIREQNMARAIIVVDMLRGFLEEGYPLYCGAESRKIIPNVQRLLKDMQAEGATIIYLADTHDPDDKEFQMFPPHCVKGTAESQVIPELSEYPGLLIPKRRYSGFFDTELEDRLAEIQPDEVVVVGVCTDICVMHTVADLRNRDYLVVVYADCVASFDAEAHAFALKHIERILGAQVVDRYKPE